MPKILIVEHEVMLREEMAAWLALEGFAVLSAKDGLTGVDSAFRHEPDVILCDLLLPGMDGYAVLAEIRAHPATAHTPFIFLIEPAMQIDIRQGMGLDASNYMIKPLHRPELLAAIRAYVAQKPVQDHACDIEQLQAALAQQQVQDQLKTNLLGMFANQAHNPLTNILLANHLFCGQADDGDEQDNLIHVNQVEASVRQLMHMLDDLLLIAQLDSGTLDIKPEPVHVGQFLQQIVQDYQAIQGEKHQIRLATHTSTPILLDKRLLRQVTTNLIANALQHSEIGGSVFILVESHKDGCRLVVQDHSCDVRAAAQSQRCEPIARSTNGSVNGGGLGWAQIKQVVELQGGFVDMEHQVGIGTTVAVTIPTQRGAVMPLARERINRQVTESWHKMAARGLADPETM